MTGNVALVLSSSQESSVLKTIGKIGFALVILLALVGITSVVARFVLTVRFLIDPSVVDTQAGDPGAGFNERYYAHPYLTLLHIVPGFLFMTLGPMQFIAAIRNRWLNFHRWCGRIYLVASLVGVLSALVIVPVMPVFGSFTARVAVIFGASLFLVSLVKGYLHIRRFEIAEHREWMIRAFAIGLGISTFRVALPVLMLLGASFTEAWDTVTWLGFAINLVIAEVWINLTRREAARPARVPIPAPKIPTGVIPSAAAAVSV
jgi:hypothetical protein